MQDLTDNELRKRLAGLDPEMRRKFERLSRQDQVRLLTVGPHIYSVETPYGFITFEEEPGEPAWTWDDEKGLVPSSEMPPVEQPTASLDVKGACVSLASPDMLTGEAAERQRLTIAEDLARYGKSLSAGEEKAPAAKNGHKRGQKKR